MDTVVVVPGGLTEMLQAAPLIDVVARHTSRPVLVVGGPSTTVLRASLSGAGEFLTVPGLTAAPGALAAARLWRALRGRRLDTAFVCSDSPVVRAVVYLAGVARRLGCAGGAADRLLSDPVPSHLGNHAGDWQALCTRLGASVDPAAGRLLPDTAAESAAETLVLRTDLGDGRLLVAIAPGAAYAELPQPAWPAERFAHLGNRLATRHGAGVVLLGDERDLPVVEAVRLDLAAPSVDLCGQIDLRTAAAVLARCHLLVAGDSPLLHLAAAVGTPSIGLFAATDGRTRAPHGLEHRVVQALPEDARPASIGRIRVDDVLAGIEMPQ